MVGRFLEEEKSTNVEDTESLKSNLGSATKIFLVHESNKEVTEL